MVNTLKIPSIIAPTNGRGGEKERGAVKGGARERCGKGGDRERCGKGAGKGERERENGVGCGIVKEHPAVI